ncbi:hypothetical protein IMSHALPRED_002241 [Imshaugia aleurites]|uniref:Uncharacterized protein n=1 Tax=Imshaugia aleurites TaxID=172621 RepID=A0A8H3J5P8_9LECA|nr:hypothetical protein IMSHALPRED_002241 [Imshaugia aleurites]
MDPETQRLADRMDAEEDMERARKEAEMNTPENRRKAADAKVAERERKRINFHFCRALPTYMQDGWRHIRADEFTDQEIRVYTEANERRRFWGIKPAGMGIDEFWERNDPEVGRYDDRIAMTWENPLIPPPITIYSENKPVIWAGQGPNPDMAPPEPPIAEVPQPTKAAAKSRRRQKTSDVNPLHRVKKSTADSSKINKNTRNSLADNAALLPSGAPQEPATEDGSSAPAKRPRGRPSGTPKLAVTDEPFTTPKRPRGRPAANPKPITKDQNELPIKRPRGRPPGKGNPAERGRPSKQKKASAIQGNARITKSSQSERRPSAPSTHKMRTRREGPAELLKLT